ncbi:MAG: hypothetical protein SAMD01599839_12680 [Rectinema sp.]
MWDAVLPLKINAENLGRCFKFTLVIALVFSILGPIAGIMEMPSLLSPQLHFSPYKAFFL